MRNLIRALSDRAEVIIVIMAAFGYFILISLLVAFMHPSASASAASSISQSGLNGLVVQETIMFALLWGFLHVRGWRFATVGLVPSLRDSMTGIGIVVLMYMIYTVMWMVLGRLIIGYHAQADTQVVHSLSLATIIAVSVINPVFEEVFVCGYLITALRKTRSLTFAVNVSVAIRLAYHLYQGAIGVYNIIPMGIIFAYWYARTGRLWPLVIAHAFFDFIALVIYAKH